MVAQPQNYNTTGISETWWEEACDWCVVMDIYRLLRRDRHGQAAPYVTEALDCTELAIGEDTVKSLWVGTKGQANKGDVIIGVYSRLPSQDDNTNDLFFRERRDTSRSAALVLMGDFNLPDLNWGKSHS